MREKALLLFCNVRKMFKFQYKINRRVTVSESRQKSFLEFKVIQIDHIHIGSSLVAAPFQFSLSRSVQIFSVTTTILDFKLTMFFVKRSVHLDEVDLSSVEDVFQRKILGKKFRVR